MGAWVSTCTTDRFAVRARLGFSTGMQMDSMPRERYLWQCGIASFKQRRFPDKIEVDPLAPLLQEGLAGLLASKGLPSHLTLGQRTYHA